MQTFENATAATQPRFANPFSHIAGHTLAEDKILDTGKIDRYPLFRVRTKIRDFSADWPRTTLPSWPRGSTFAAKEVAAKTSFWQLRTPNKLRFNGLVLRRQDPIMQFATNVSSGGRQ